METVGKFWVVVAVVAGACSSAKQGPPSKSIAPPECGRGNERITCSDGGIQNEVLDTRARPFGWGYMQGSFVEGEGLEGRHFSLQNAGSCSQTTPFPPCAGMTLATSDTCGTSPITIKILGCESGTSAYSCKVSVTNTPGWEICGSTSQDPIGVAIVGGYWDSSGKFQPDSGLVTLSCNAEGSPGEKQLPWTDGAISRCLRDPRYEPDDTDGDKNLTACIRMTRADYCGDGKSYTYIGTNIDVHDDKKHMKEYNKNKECGDGRCFEASWSERGAECVAHTRWKDVDITKICQQNPFTDSSQAGVLCRSDSPRLNKQSLFTRSRTNSCGNDPTSCGPDLLSPGCP
jgi:hypothetical protein